jgi:hypothetical protein
MFFLSSCSALGTDVVDVDNQYIAMSASQTLPALALGTDDVDVDVDHNKCSGYEARRLDGSRDICHVRYTEE